VVGHISGSTRVTIVGESLGGGNDVFAVTFAGTRATIVSQTARVVVVITAARATNGTGFVTVSSNSTGTAISTTTFTYYTNLNASCPAFGGVINTVLPSQGPRAGGNLITISGSALGSGSDIYEVSLRSILATIVSQNASEVVVRSNGISVGNGDVIVKSTCFGVSILKNGFSIWPPIEPPPPASNSSGYTYLKRTLQGKTIEELRSDAVLV
jgi:hypothetical protein